MSFQGKAWPIIEAKTGQGQSGRRSSSAQESKQNGYSMYGAQRQAIL